MHFLAVFHCPSQHYTMCQSWTINQNRKILGNFQRIIHYWQKRKDLAEAEEIKKCKNTQKNYSTKWLHDLDNHDGVVTHLEPDILEVKSSGP